MNKQLYESLIEQDVDKFITTLMPHGGGATITEQLLRLHLKTLIQQIAYHTRSYELVNIRTSDQLAEEWGVSKRRVQAIITDRHERWGAGMKVGRDWILSADEAERYKPDPANRNGGRPRK